MAEPEKIDLNPMALAILHPNPVVILEKGRNLFIKLHSINVIEVVTDSGKDEVTMTMTHGESLLLSSEESREFVGKVTQIAAQVEMQMRAAQRQAMQVVGSQLGIKG